MAAFTTARMSELPLRSTIPLSSSASSYCILTSPFRTVQRPRFCSSYLYYTLRSHFLFSKKTASDFSLLAKSIPKPSSDRSISATSFTSKGQNVYDKDKAQGALDRIVLRLRNLGLDEQSEVSDGRNNEASDENISLNAPVTGEEKLSELLQREWIRPDAFLRSDDDDDLEDGNGELLLPWEREDKNASSDLYGRRKRRPSRAPTLAELTMEDDELRRLRRNGLLIRERITIPKAGLTQPVLEKIHDKWRKEELVRLKFHEELTHDMKTAHEIVERRTGGMVTWRAGSVMVVYRGPYYQGPAKSMEVADEQGNEPFVPNIQLNEVDVKKSAAEYNTIPTRTDQVEEMTEEEAEYNRLLDGLGSRYEDWWGTGFFPVDADKLPEKIPGYRTPLRFLPAGMRSKLTNSEVTNLRKLSKSLPCHFALGRNRNHHGLAASIIKLWEKSLIVKIAVKRGIQNTNNKLMAEELKELTGGVLLLRNKYYIVIYRGKDYVPKTVAAALAERDEQSKQSVDMEEMIRCKIGVSSSIQDEIKVEKDAIHEIERGKLSTKLLSQDEGKVVAGTLAEFYEAQSRWRRNISDEQYEKMMEEASRAKKERIIKGIERKVSVAQAKKHKAEGVLAKIEASMVGAGPDQDQETITDEERAMFRRLGLRMKAYLPVGIRGIFDGVIENMHLHWKHRELVKLISKEKSLERVEDTGRLLEYESGGILVATERVPKGFALIYYRGKNYKRPISIRPPNLLNKAKALKRSVAIQRHEALSEHIRELEKTIDQMKKDLVNYEANGGSWDAQDDYFASESTNSEEDDEDDEDDDVQEYDADFIEDFDSEEDEDDTEEEEE